MESSLKTLRFQERIEQINKEASGGKANNKVIHGISPYSLSQAFTKAQKISKTIQPTPR
jgi:hypothetical protein